MKIPPTTIKAAAIDARQRAESALTAAETTIRLATDFGVARQALAAIQAAHDECQRQTNDCADHAKAAANLAGQHTFDAIKELDQATRHAQLAQLAADAAAWRYARTEDDQ